MASFFVSPSSFIIFLVLASITLPCFALHDDRKVFYVVYMGSLPSETEYVPTSHHHSLLQEILEGNSLATDVIAHSYKRSFNGFAAKLTEQGSSKAFGNSLTSSSSTCIYNSLLDNKLKKHDRVSVCRNGGYNNGEFTDESDIIVGIIDSGIWRLIGARVYATEVGDSSPNARDIFDAIFYDLAKGKARGAVPSQELFVYKVCSSGDEDPEMELIYSPYPWVVIGLFVSYKDPYAIGAFHAIEKDILTSRSRRSNGPSQEAVISTAPWMFKVGATIIDRHLVTKVGHGVNALNLSGINTEYGDNVSTGECVNASARRCGQQCLDRKLVKGKIIICDGVYGVEKALKFGARGTILIDNEFFGYDDCSSRIFYIYNDSVVYPMSATLLSSKAGKYVKSYFNSTRKGLFHYPVATILKTESIRNDRAPMVPSFSSRGPNKIMPDIIKPDIMAPGADILAAFSPVVSPADSSNAAWSVNYTFLSGTSMSCPHATGAAAYVKSFHPDWPASFIKSALMTTAFDMFHTRDPGREFSYGSGQIDPLKAINPGLVYHTSTEDYISMLCNVGLDAKKIRLITNRSCPSKIRPGNARDLNYPSLGAHIVAHKPFKLTFRRTVTNVGNPHSTYHVTIRADSDRINVTSFVVTVVGDAFDYSETATGSLVWSDGNHTVRSPLVVYTYDFEHH
ncbi:hypothetical protein MKW92_011987 [Papaver armeniacum]|nr:hypothetical protein MKW92_011987 [Papaver armeniacum]